jgi:hypothetical protein
MIFNMKLKTSLPVIWLETIDFEKSGFVRTQQTTHNWSWFLVDPVDDEIGRDRPRTDPPNVWQCDLKNLKNINTHPICIVIDNHFLTLHWLGNRIIKYLMWSQINVLLSIRLTGGRQIDFKVFKLLL